MLLQIDDRYTICFTYPSPLVVPLAVSESPLQLLSVLALPLVLLVLVRAMVLVLVCGDIFPASALRLLRLLSTAALSTEAIACVGEEALTCTRLQGVTNTPHLQ